MNLKQVIIVYRKEMKDILRDRRTLISMILIPILIFPLLTVGMSSLMKTQMKKIKEKTMPVIIMGEEHAPELYDFLIETGMFLFIDTAEDSLGSLEMLEDRAVLSIISLPPGFEERLRKFFRGEGEAPALEIIYDQSEIESEITFNKLRGFLSEYRRRVVSDELERLNLRGDLTEPFAIESINAASEERMGGFMAGMLLPYMVIILTLVGAMYPAIDLTAGEKERGTLETLLVSPVGRMEMVLGKFTTILTASLATAILAIASMTLTLSGGFLAASAVPEMRMSLSFISIIWVILMMVPLAALFSALLMSIAVFARSYREAQSYISPLMIVAILPAMVSFIPGIGPTIKLALIPVINVSLMLKETLMGRYDPVLILLTVVSTVVYAAFAIWTAFRQFQRESVLFRV